MKVNEREKHQIQDYFKLQRFEEVLREHLKGHLRVYEMIDAVDKPVDVTWKQHLKEQIEKLNGGEKESGFDRSRDLSRSLSTLKGTDHSDSKPPSLAGSARQTDYSHAECSRQKAVFSLTSLRGCSGRIEGIWDTRECYDCLYNPNYIPVETEDLEFIFSKDPEFMNLEELRRRKEIEEKYLPEKEEKEKWEGKKK